MPNRFRALITDLDNTLYNWYAFFIPAFYGMISDAARILDCPESQLIEDMRRVHVRFGDVEHPFALIQSDLVRQRFPNLSEQDLVKRLDSAFHVFNQIRKDKLRLFPTVKETITALRDSGVTIIGHTDSKSFAAVGRLEKLNIIECFDVIYCQSRHTSEHPLPERRGYWTELLSKFPIRELPSHQKKPHPEVLKDILRGERITSAECVYVGDSKSRDILMAKRANVFSVWAKYGAWRDDQAYQQLIAISHWTGREIQEEIDYSVQAKSIQPDFTLNDEFGELLQLLAPARATVHT